MEALRPQPLRICICRMAGYNSELSHWEIYRRQLSPDTCSRCFVLFIRKFNFGSSVSIIKTANTCRILLLFMSGGKMKKTQAQFEKFIFCRRCSGRGRAGDARSNSRGWLPRPLVRPARPSRGAPGAANSKFSTWKMLEKNYVYLVFLDGTAVELLSFGPFFNFLDLRRLVLVVDCLKKKTWLE